MSLDIERSIDELRRSFQVDPDALLNAEAILRLQARTLEADPPPELPDLARTAAEERLAAGEPIIPRARFPFERVRVAEMLAHLSAAVHGDARGLVHRDLAYLLEGVFSSH